MKFSLINQNNSPAIGDNAVGVTAAGVDQKSTWAAIAALISANLATGSVTGANLATSAILLASVKVTTSQTISTTTATLITGLASTVTMPPGGRKTKITVVLGSPYNSTAAGGMVLSIWKGAVGSGTQLNSIIVEKESVILARGIMCIAIDDSPSVGSNTYSVGFATSSSGGVTTNSNATQPAMLIVEAV